MALREKHGFSLVEVLVVIVALGIAAAVAISSLVAVLKDERREETEQEMKMLAQAIAGDPDLTQAGIRCDFGYLGDVGAFPPNLQALAANPGGYATWKGPYLPAVLAGDTVAYRYDAWGAPYLYNGVAIRSTGSGEVIDWKIANAAEDYLRNHVYGTLCDAADNVPGSKYRDSVDILITIPNGAGSLTTKLYRPDSSGTFCLDSLPCGRHRLQLAYTPAGDTLERILTVLPRHKSSARYHLAQAYFSGGDTLPPDREFILSTTDAAALGGLSFQDEDLVDYYSGPDSAVMQMDGSTVFSGNEDVDAFHLRSDHHYILSAVDNASIHFLNFHPDDLVDYDPVTGHASIFLAGNVVFDHPENIDAVYLMENGHIILSTAGAATIGGLSFAGDDLVEYNPSTGQASVFLDGGTVFAGPADIDAVHILDNGHIIISTADDNEIIGGLTVQSEDLIEYDPVSRSAVIYFDGDGPFGTPDENVDAVCIGAGGQANDTILSADFDPGTDGFTYLDDPFRGTSQPSYANGSRVGFGGHSRGALRVRVGDINNNPIPGMSGGWRTNFNLAAAKEVVLFFWYNMTQSRDYEPDEYSQVLVDVDGTLYGRSPNDYVDQITGDGPGGWPPSTGWRYFEIDLGTLSIGNHSITVGLYNNKKDAINESTEARFDDILLLGY